MIDHPVSQKLIIFDADGTLSECTVPGQPRPNRPGEWVLAPNVRKTLAKYQWADPYDFSRRATYDPSRHYWGMASNQGGVELGFMTYAMAFQLLKDRAYDAGLLRAHEVHDLPIAMCLHNPHARPCICRKPSPYLLLQIANFYGIEYAEDILFVGDHETDEMAAQRCGVAYMHPRDFFGWQDNSWVASQ